MKVVVIGGGVVGLSAAFALHQRGATVSVVDAGRCGHGASFGNAGWVTPGYSTPLPGPGIPLQALRWTLDGDSPLLIRPTLRPAFLWWCVQFLRHCRADAFKAGLTALVGLNRRTLEYFDTLRSAGVDFEMHSAGLIFLARSERAVAQEAAILSQLRDAGYDGRFEVLAPPELRRVEPSVSDAVAGGVFAVDERHVRPESLTGGLRGFLERSGVEIIEGSEVIGLQRGHGNAWRVQTATIAHDADRVVIAGGVATRHLLRSIGVRIPLEAAKGYSITATGAGLPPRHPLGMLEARVACTPFDGGVRLAGTLELGRIDDRVRRRRIAALAEAAEVYLRDWRPEVRTLEWAGMRPTTPDGLPLIGEIPGARGVYVATGHAMLGVTLAPATGFCLARAILDGVIEPELRPFSIPRPR